MKQTPLGRTGNKDHYLRMAPSLHSYLVSGWCLRKPINHIHASDSSCKLISVGNWLLKGFPWVWMRSEIQTAAQIQSLHLSFKDYTFKVLPSMQSHHKGWALEGMVPAHRNQVGLTAGGCQDYSDNKLTCMMCEPRVVLIPSVISIYTRTRCLFWRDVISSFVRSLRLLLLLLQSTCGCVPTCCAKGELRGGI